MGSWGVEPYDCDEGLDIKERWAQLNHVEITDYESVADQFFLKWNDSLKYGDTITNNEVIALCSLYIESNIPLPSKLLKATENAINRELEETELANWSEESQEKRENFLTLFLLKIGGVRKPPPKNGFLGINDSILFYKSANTACQKLIKSFVKMKSSKTRISLKKAGFPSFMLTIDRLMNFRIWEKDSKLYAEVTNERLMILATYLALRANLTQEELENLLQKINYKE